MSEETLPRSENLPCSRYGRFLPETGSFLIEDPLTPRPWINVMSNGSYGLVLSQAGGGFSWIGNSQLGRITRWEQDLARDAHGRWLYVADRDTGAIHTTSLGPSRKRAESDEVEHGLGYSTFRRTENGIESDHTFFVPEGHDCECWIVRIRNRRPTPARLRVGAYLEWFLGEQGEWHREFHRLFISTSVEGRRLVVTKRPPIPEDRDFRPESPLSASLEAIGLDGANWFCDKSQFLGRAGLEAEPQALISAEKPANTGSWDDPVGAFTAELELAPGESKSFAVVIAAVQGESKNLPRPFQTLEAAESALEATRRFHADRSGALAIETLDPVFDLMNNAWLPYQAEVGRMKARCAYFQQGGAYGFRDQLQDSLMLLEIEPGATLAQIGIHAEAMYEDGGVRHWWHPNSQIFAASKHSDTSLWPAYALLEYMDETDDLAACHVDLAYLSRETEKPGARGTLLDHCLRGIERALDRRSKRGLPLIGAGDWNDGLSHAGLEGRGESVWLAMFLHDVLRRLAPVISDLGDGATASRFQQEAGDLQRAVETHGWDGDWYIAGTNDEGRPFGSKENRSGSIFLNPQTWAVISGIASPERAEAAMNSVRRRLIKPYGPLLLAPAYCTPDPHIGYITRYAPGLRENGGVYCHAATWAIQALARHGDLDGAYALYRSLLPPLRSADDPDRYQAEPYVMPGNVDGPDSPFEGRAGWTWYTGTAAWLRRTATHWILGVRPTREGLVARGSLPQGLGPVSMVRPFRGDTFDISLSANTAEALYVDGNPHSGPILPSGKGLRRTVETR
ncbi:MAG: glycosyl transferase family 36 [Armatimonadetes bacterium]|nr:glycosyl transferase family 36 [Armatimonadota bacterium]